MNLDLFLFHKLNSFAGKSVCSDSIFIFFAEYLGYILIFILFLFLLKNSKKYKNPSLSLGNLVPFWDKNPSLRSGTLFFTIAQDWPMVLQAILAAILARFGITELIRFFWERQRPFVENNMNLLFDHPVTGSFPSGHAAFFFGLSTVVYLHNKKAGILFFFASFLISISRVISGVHWPSDILAGAAVGIFSGFLIFHLFKKLISKKSWLSVSE